MVARIFLLFCLLLIIYVSRNFSLLKIRIYTRIIFVAILILCGLFIAFPGISQSLANLLGIGRGADLVLYIIALSQIGLIGVLIAKFREVESHQSRITRELAITNHKMARENRHSSVKLVRKRAMLPRDTERK
jgi:hypothetical protein